MDWETVIGLEVHVELSTNTKIFCSCTTKFGGRPNTHCCPVCMGMPGTLPVLNKKVLEYAVKAGIALNCEITQYNKFDRKNYFYPDLPKSYQISQLYLPFAKNGYVNITDSDNCSKKIRIHEIHMEEDAGKLIHSDTSDKTFCDYNRAGIPLIEIVTEPDFRNSDEVVAFLTKVKSTFEYLGISDCKMQEGSMRADVNLSVKPYNSNVLGTRTETKNVNSFKFIRKAIAFEAQRQKDILRKGGKIIQETRRFDETRKITIPMRSKENADDYRYFPEPDIPPLRISNKTILEYKASMPEFPCEKIKRYISQYELPEADAKIIAADKHLAELFENTVNICKNPLEVKFWIVVQTMCIIKEKGLLTEDISLSPKVFAEFISLIISGKINRQTAKSIFEVMFFENDDFNPSLYVKENNLEQVQDVSAIKDVICDVFKDNPKTVAQYKNGETKVIGFFVGQTMKKLKGKARPDTVNRILREELSRL